MGLLQACIQIVGQPNYNNNNNNIDKHNENTTDKVIGAP